jgi:hypothetical protein
MTRIFRGWISGPAALPRGRCGSAQRSWGLASKLRPPRTIGGKKRGQTGAGGKPVMAIVSLREQRISIYDARGKFLQAPVSTGSAGYETPAGIFAIVP